MTAKKKKKRKISPKSSALREFEQYHRIDPPKTWAPHDAACSLNWSTHEGTESTTGGPGVIYTGPSTVIFAQCHPAGLRDGTYRSGRGTICPTVRYSMQYSAVQLRCQSGRIEQSCGPSTLGLGFRYSAICQVLTFVREPRTYPVGLHHVRKYMRCYVGREPCRGKVICLLRRIVLYLL